MPVAGAFGVGPEVGDFALDDLDLLGCEVRAALFEQGLGVRDERGAAGLFHLMAPAALLLAGWRTRSAEGGGELPCVFAGVPFRQAQGPEPVEGVEVEDLHRVREVEPRVFPNPRGTIAQTDGGERPGVAAAQGLGPQPGADLAAVLEGAHVAGRAGVAQGLAFFIGGGLRKDAAQFGFPGARGAVGLSALDAGQFAAPQRDARAVAGHIEDGDGLARGCRQGGLRRTQDRDRLRDETPEVAPRELEPQVGVKILRRGVVGAALGGRAADEARQAGRMSAHHIQGVIQRAAPGVRPGVVVIPAAQPDDAKERSNLARAILVDDFQSARRLLVAHQAAVIEQAFDDASRIAKQRIAQARFQALDDTGYPFLRERFAERREEGFCFAVSFLETFRLEFFLP